MGSKPEVAEHYSTHYRDFAADVYGLVLVTESGCELLTRFPYDLARRA